ncbi:Argonaute complex, subunit Arb1 [Chaetomium strumarium]|uniref:Argonaute complex, subunit Arb1 n=1 Tax=Chaetomium strumarium TaxID=1170767 RepID=A0AAJ0GV84_9PEZI|nr:Argonaute complex, subunit Arb1 [Chaetomium strumarium]
MFSLFRLTGTIMASLPNSNSAPLEDAQNNGIIREPSQHHENGKVRVEEDKPKKDKKNKSTKRSAGAKKRGTGFEEFYCDPPMTPAEHEEEVNLIYAPHVPFVDRIQECIQRYRARRRMTPERSTLFTRYLLLGGIDATVRQFGGAQTLTDEVLEDTNRAAVREMTANDVIQRGGDDSCNPRFYNPNDAVHWDVDFTGIAAGFLSEHLPKMVGSELDDFRMGVDVVLNFLKYVDRHDVCPEYIDDVRGAQKICLQALDEIPAIQEMLKLVPGPFNTALRVLHFKEEDDHALGSEYFSDTAVPDAKYARISHAATLSILFGPKRFRTDAEWAVTETIEYDLEVREISLPNDAVRAKYTAINQHLSDYPDIQPCGTVIAHPIIIRDGWDNTTTVTIPPDDDVDIQLILEEDILRLLKVGMKLTMEVCTLNVGLKFIKRVREIKASFYVFLPQELMFNYKEPIASERPSRSIHDVDNEEEDGDD